MENFIVCAVSEVYPLAQTLFYFFFLHLFDNTYLKERVW